jgi:hypothetical protein
MEEDDQRRIRTLHRDAHDFFMMVRKQAEVKELIDPGFYLRVDRRASLLDKKWSDWACNTDPRRTSPMLPEVCIAVVSA